MKRPRSINYKFNIIINSIINYNLDFDILFTTAKAKNFNFDFKIFNYSDIRLRKRYKLNANIMTYYYRYLNYSENII